MLLLPVNLTFNYEFKVARSELRMLEGTGVPADQLCWIGEGSGQADDHAIERAARFQAARDAESPAERDRLESIAKIVRVRGGVEDPPVDPVAQAEGLVGAEPKFELCAGWLTLLPAEGWTQSLPVRWFSDAEVLRPTRDQGQEAFDSFLRRLNERRNLKLFSLYVGETLQNILRIGDTLRFSRNERGAFTYLVVESNGEVVLSAGGLINGGGPVALWQEYDSVPNPNAGQIIHGIRVAEQIPVIRPYVSVIVNDQVFHLLAGQDLYVDPYYVFLARSNYHGMSEHLLLGFSLPAVHAAGRIGTLRKKLTRDLIRNAAHELTKPRTRTL
jgi:hypothetical protein